MTPCAPARRRSVAGRWVGLVCGIGAAGAAGADERTPFRTRNLSPLVSIFGIPAWERAEAGTHAGFTLELANHYRFSQRGRETLILDGETWRGALWLRHGFGEGWTASLEMPYYRQWGGVLDDPIDAWHSAFNLPDGGRNLRGEDRIVFVLADGSEPFYVLDGSARGTGDVLLGLGRSLGSDGATSIQATLKLPTGDEDVLAGSGAADVAITLMRSRGVAVRGRPAGWFWGVGALAVGDPDRIEFDTNRAVLLGMLGGAFRPWTRTGLKAQIEVHGALFDSPLRELGDAGVQATIGGWRELGERAVVEFAVNEDLAVSTSPDVVLHLTLKWTFRE